MITAFSISLPFQELKARSAVPPAAAHAATDELQLPEVVRLPRLPELKLKTDCVAEEQAWAA